MQVNSTTNNSSESSVTTRKTTNSLDKDAFLKLLIEQLKNQDPMNPQDSAEFISQMSQFSILEQLTNLNNTMSELMESQKVTQAAELIGQQVNIKTADGPVNGEVEKVTFSESGSLIYVNGVGYDIGSVTEIAGGEPEQDERITQLNNTVSSMNSTVGSINSSLAQALNLLRQLLPKE